MLDVVTVPHGEPGEALVMTSEGIRLHERTTAGEDFIFTRSVHPRGEERGDSPVMGSHCSGAASRVAGACGTYL